MQCRDARGTPTHPEQRRDVLHDAVAEELLDGDRHLERNLHHVRLDDGVQVVVAAHREPDVTGCTFANKNTTHAQVRERKHGRSE
jgi:hypothetical protein